MPKKSLSCGAHSGVCVLSTFLAAFILVRDLCISVVHVYLHLALHQGSFFILYFNLRETSPSASRATADEHEVEGPPSRKAKTARRGRNRGRYASQI